MRSVCKVLTSVAFVCMLFGFSSITAYSQCPCTEPLCPPPDLSCSTVVWVPGTMTIPLSIGSNCVVTVFFCSRNLTGTACAFGAPYGVSCEYKLTKVCFPSGCAVDCSSAEMNSILLNILMVIAKANPHGHFVPSVAQWNNPSPNLKTTWKLSFPACYQCEVDGMTGCTTLTPCDNNTCSRNYEVYVCGPVCPTMPPMCPSPCPSGIQLTYVPGSQYKSVGECENHACTLCGY